MRHNEYLTATATSEMAERVRSLAVENGRSVSCEIRAILASVLGMDA